MRVRRVGLKLSNSNNKIKTDEFIEYLKSFNFKSFSYESGERFFLFHQDEEFITGVVLTFKDQKKDCRARMSDGKFIIHTSDVLKDEKLIDFNFFAIKKATLKGLYEYYHNSCSIHVLYALLRRSFNNLKEEVKSNFIKDNLSLGKEKAERKADRFFSGRLQTQILIDERDIVSVLADFSKVKKIEMSYYADQFNVGHATALQKRSKDVKVSFNIIDSEQSNVSILSESIKTLAETKGFKKGSVSTTDTDDIERVISIINMPKQLGECDFESLAFHIEGLTSENFHENEILLELKREITDGDYRELFN
ncbi:hypothetical protein [Pantoea agglomerans]